MASTCSLVRLARRRSRAARRTVPPLTSAISAAASAPAVPICRRTCRMTSGRLVWGISETGIASAARSQPRLTCQRRMLRAPGVAGVDAFRCPHDPVLATGQGKQREQFDAVLHPKPADRAVTADCDRDTAVAGNVDGPGAPWDRPFPQRHPSISVELNESPQSAPSRNRSPSGWIARLREIAQGMERQQFAVESGLGSAVPSGHCEPALHRAWEHSPLSSVGRRRSADASNSCRSFNPDGWGLNDDKRSVLRDRESALYRCGSDLPWDHVPAGRSVGFDHPEPRVRRCDQKRSVG